MDDGSPAHLPHVLIPDNQVLQQNHLGSASIPATLVVKSDGSLAISSDAIDTQSNPIQLVMIPNSDGKTNLYMVPRKNNDLNQAFLIKPIDGQGWNVDNASSEAVGNNAGILNISSNIPIQTSTPDVIPALTVHGLIDNPNAVKNDVNMANVPKAVTTLSSAKTIDFVPSVKTEPVEDIPQGFSTVVKNGDTRTSVPKTVTALSKAKTAYFAAPGVKTELVEDETPGRSAATGSVPMGPLTTNNSTTEPNSPAVSLAAASKLIRALLQQKIAKQTNIEQQVQQQQPSVGSQDDSRISNIPSIVPKVLKLRRTTSVASGEQITQPQTVSAELTTTTTFSTQTPAKIVNQVQPTTDVQQVNPGLGVQTAQMSTVGLQQVVYIPANNLARQYQSSYAVSNPVLSGQLAQLPLAGTQTVQYLPVYNQPQVIQPQGGGIIHQNLQTFMTQVQTIAAPNVNYNQTQVIQPQSVGIIQQNTQSYLAQGQTTTAPIVNYNQPQVFQPQSGGIIQQNSKSYATQGQTVVVTTAMNVTYNQPQLVQAQNVGILQQNSPSNVTQGQTKAVTVEPNVNSLVNMAYAQTAISSTRAELEVVLGAHNSSSNVAPLAQYLSTVLGNNSQIQYKFTVPQKSGSNGSGINAAPISPNKNTESSSGIGELHASNNESVVSSLQSKHQSEVSKGSSSGLSKDPSDVGWYLFMNNGQHYLVDVNKGSGDLSVRTLSSATDPLNVASQSSVIVSSTKLVSSNTPVMSTTALESKNSDDNVIDSSLSKAKQSGELVPIKLPRTFSGIHVPKPLSESDRLSRLTAEQLMELNDIMAREHVGSLGEPVLDHVNAIVDKILGPPRPVTVVDKTTKQKLKSTIQNKNCGVDTDEDSRPPKRKRRKTGGRKGTECDNDLDAMNPDKDKITTFYSDGTFTGPALKPSLFPPLPDPDDVRPMLLFRSDIARKLKPATLREGNMPSSIKTTTSMISPMVFSITKSTSSSVTSCKTVSSSRDASTQSATSPAIQMDSSKVNSSGTSFKVSPMLGNSDAGKDSLAILTGVKASSAHGPQDERVPLKTIGTNILKDLLVSNKSTSQAPSTATGTISLVRRPEQVTTQASTTDKKLATVTTFFSRSRSKEEHLDVDVIHVESDSDPSNDKKEDSVDNVKEPMPIKIDAVFSLNPEGVFNSEQNLQKQDNLKQNELNRKDQTVIESDESDVEIIDPPDYHNNEDVIIIDDELDDEDITMTESPSENQTKMKSMDAINESEYPLAKHSCRVVLRCMNMKKFHQPYSFEYITHALSQNVCSKTCRQMAVHNYFEKGAAISITRLPTCSGGRQRIRYIPYVKVNPKRLKGKLSKVDPNMNQSNVQSNTNVPGRTVNTLKQFLNNRTTHQAEQTDRPRTQVLSLKDVENQHVAQRFPDKYIKDKTQNSADLKLCGYSPEGEKILVSNARAKALYVDGGVTSEMSAGRLISPDRSQQGSVSTETSKISIVQTPTYSLTTSRAVSLPSTLPSALTSSLASTSSLSLTSQLPPTSSLAFTSSLAQTPSLAQTSQLASTSSASTSLLTSLSLLTSTLTLTSPSSLAHMPSCTSAPATEKTTNKGLTSSFPGWMPMKSILPFPITTKAAEQNDVQVLDTKIDPSTSLSGGNVKADETLTDVKSEPVVGGYDGGVRISLISCQAISGQPNNSDGKSTDEVGDGIKDASRNEDTEKGLLDNSEVSHLERIKRLKEQLQQEQAALEEIRKQRLLEGNMSDDS